MKNYKINIFDLNIYIENNEQITKIIQNKLKEKDLSIRDLSKKINLSNTTIYSFLKGSSMRSQNLKKIFDFLNIHREYLEKLNLTIFSGPYKFRKYNLRFPIKLTPLHIRVVSHFLGDSSLEKYGCRWYQKSNIGGKFMINLIYHLLNIKIKKGKKNSYGIPIIIGDIVCSPLKLLRKDLKSHKFIDKINILSKESKIQLLAAIIVDEGHISKSSIKISNTNLKLLESLRNLILSLGYSCSEIKNYHSNIGKEISIKNKKTRVNYNLYDLHIYADGLLKFKEDLSKMIKGYGNFVSLWQKQNDLLKFSSKVNLNRLKKTRISKNNLIPLIKKEILFNPISIKEFANKHNLNYIRAYKLFFRLKEKGEIKKISTGIFASKDYDVQTNFTLRSKIEEFLSEKSISVKEIQNQIGGNFKSISTQLSKLYKAGKIKKKEKGIYYL